MVDVVALGAIVESEDLTGPPRRPKLDMRGYVQPQTPEELDGAEDYVFPPDRSTGRIQSGWSDLKVPDRRRDRVVVRLGSIQFGWADLVRKLAKLGGKRVFCTRPPETKMAGRRKGFESGRLSLYAEEFADLSDGRRVILKDDRGWSLLPNHDSRYPRYPDSSWKFENGHALTFEAATVLQPDYNELWMEWVVERLGFFGVDVDLVSVHAAPFRVEFSPRVQRELRQRKSDGQVPDMSERSRTTVPDRERRVVLDVIALGAIVEIEESGQPQFHAEEFADLSDGRRVILKYDGYWSDWPMNFPNSSWKVATGHELTIEAIAMLSPGDDEHWMEWVVKRLRLFDIDVDPVSVRAAPFHVEFGPRVRHELRQRKSDG